MQKNKKKRKTQIQFKRQISSGSRSKGFSGKSRLSKTRKHVSALYRVTIILLAPAMVGFLFFTLTSCNNQPSNKSSMSNADTSELVNRNDFQESADTASTPKKVSNQQISKTTTPTGKQKYTYFDGRIASDEINNLPRELIYEAIENGAKEVTIPPGIYRMLPERNNCHISIEGAKNLTINAPKVLILCDKLTRCIQVRDCENLVIKGLTIDYSMNAFHFTQGDVIAVAKEGDSTIVDIKIHDGYPLNDNNRIEIYNRKTRFRKDRMPFMWGNKTIILDKKKRIVRAKDKGLAFTEVGDLASLTGGWGTPHAIDMGYSTGTSFYDVTIHASISFGIVHMMGGGGGIFKGVRIVPGPTPPGASEPRLVSTQHDGWKIGGLNKGITVEDCEISHTGDDAWSIAHKCQFMPVNISKNKVILLSKTPYIRGESLKPGFHLRTGIKDPKVKIKKMVRFEKSSWSKLKDVIEPKLLKKITEAGPWDYYKYQAIVFELELESLPTFEVGEALFCEQLQCNGYIFRNNKLHSSGRLLLSAGSDGIIENNILEGVHSIAFTPEEIGRASGMKNMIIRNNKFIHMNYNCPSWQRLASGPFPMAERKKDNTARESPAFINFIVENNVWDRCHGVNMNIVAAQDMVVRNNTFIQPGLEKPNNGGGKYKINHRVLVSVRNSKNVIFENNVIKNTGDYFDEISEVKNSENIKLEGGFKE
ncbi:MAG: right-handed parallel beta-helix repeat-containing protein [Planctomycetes bacterium]|nr:right-handed parallel beta-helix repeat-containing protein [Planctomycetota bacterium]